MRKRKREAPEKRAYRSAKERCTKPTNKFYIRYGARGITFEFESFEQFFTELGPRPEGFSLDRIDNNQGYKPGNVRWASPRTQARNRRVPMQISDSGYHGISIHHEAYTVRAGIKYIGRAKTIEAALKLQKDYYAK